MKHPNRPRIGLALGSGSARGWAHIGVLQALAEAGVVPDVVAGTSIGALVGAWYARGHLDAADEWVRRLTRRDVIRLMDVAFVGSGVLEGKRLMDLYRDRWGDVAIEKLKTPFAAVATNLQSGQEVWLQRGSLLEAVRASISLPGLFTPVQVKDHWLVDGGLVNPVPVSVCRAMGAEVVIAVNLNGDLLGRRFARHTPVRQQLVGDASWWERLSNGFRGTALFQARGAGDGGPGFIDVLASSINIMQDRITRSRLAGEPPEILISPRLGHLELMDFARGAEAIKEGRDSVRRMLPLIHDVLGDKEVADAPFTETGTPAG